MDRVYHVVNRRRAAAMVGGAVGSVYLARVGPAHASASIGVGGASRLPPLGGDFYVPPTNLAAVADIYSRMTVPIGVGAAGPFAFVVDTGANQSVISEEIVTRLGLEIGPVEPLNGVAGMELAHTTIADLVIGDRVEAEVVMSILPARSIGGDGMLGLDRLEGRELTLDFRDKSLKIAVARRTGDDPADVAVKAHRRDGQLVIIDAELAGIPLVAFLDSGAQNTIGNMALRERAAFRSPGSHWVETTIISVTGQTIAAEMANLPHLRIGGLKLPNWPVAFADLHTFRMWNMIDKPTILIGVDILSRFESVCLDFTRDEVRFRSPASA